MGAGLVGKRVCRYMTCGVGGLADVYAYYYHVFQKNHDALFRVVLQLIPSVAGRYTTR